MHPNLFPGASSSQSAASSHGSTFVGIDKLLDARKRLSSTQRKAEVLAAMTAWIVEDNQPLITTSKPAFRWMVETIDKSCPVIS
jgi:hypothetical protein